MVTIAIIILVAVFIVIPIAKTIIGSGDTYEPDTTIIKEEPYSKYEDAEVTVEDMVLHDMNNNDDVYDIGTIDFNE